MIKKDAVRVWRNRSIDALCGYWCAAALESSRDQRIHLYVLRETETCMQKPMCIAKKWRWFRYLWAVEWVRQECPPGKLTRLLYTLPHGPLGHCSGEARHREPQATWLPWQEVSRTHKATWTDSRLCGHNREEAVDRKWVWLQGMGTLLSACYMPQNYITYG